MDGGIWNQQLEMRAPLKPGISEIFQVQQQALLLKAVLSARAGLDAHVFTCLGETHTVGLLLACLS